MNKYCKASDLVASVEQKQEWTVDTTGNLVKVATKDETTRIDGYYCRNCGNYFDREWYVDGSEKINRAWAQAVLHLDDAVEGVK